MNNYLSRFKKQTNLTTQVITVLAIVVVLNFLSYQLFARFDLTQNNIYSISQTSKKAVKNLDDVVNITAYFSENLPPQYAGVRQEVEDILNEYRTYAGSKLRVSFVDPADDEKLQRDLQLLGVPRLQFNVLENDKYEVTNGYLGLVARYGDAKQPIPVISDTQNLEYQLTSAIKKVTVADVPTVGFTTGSDEYTRTNELTIASQKLSEIYSVRDVDLSGGEAVPDDIGTLIVPGPKKAISERGRYVLDQFIMRGGSALFLVEGVRIDDNLQAYPNESGVNELLAAYGFRVEPQFVLDMQNDRASFNQGFVSFTTQYPFFVRVTDTGLNQENAAVAKLQNVVFPWSSPVTLTNGTTDDISALGWTTPAAWLMQENFNLSPQGTFGFYEDAQTYTLAAARSGAVMSAFSSYIPQDGESGEHVGQTAQAHIIVIGNAKLITDSFLQRYPDNLTMLQNLVDFVTLDGDLITIRSKTISDRPLEELADGRRNNLKYFNVFGITVIVLVFGLARYYMRKKSRFADEL